MSPSRVSPSISLSLCTPPSPQFTFTSIPSHQFTLPPFPQFTSPQYWSPQCNSKIQTPDPEPLTHTVPAPHIRTYQISNDPSAAQDILHSTHLLHSRARARTHTHTGRGRVRARHWVCGGLRCKISLGLTGPKDSNKN
jgi:hypothetical protein